MSPWDFTISANNVAVIFKGYIDPFSYSKTIIDMLLSAVLIHFVGAYSS